MSKRPIILWSVVVAWFVATSLGFLALGAYHTRPSGRGSPPDRWPSNASVPLDRSRPTLLIFIHPRCPCSAASMDELAQVLDRFRGRVAAHVLTYHPEGAAEGWESSAGGSGFDFRRDPGGREAVRFGVETSGHVLLFDPSGRRLFSGGITISRGHRGDNPGLDRLIEAVEGSSVGSGSSPVFGCPVLRPLADRSRSLAP
jgi:hypothetical protein